MQCSEKRPERELDLSQKWLRHLREAAKTTVTLSCKYCIDRKCFPSRESLFNHIQDVNQQKGSSTEEYDGTPSSPLKPPSMSGDTPHPSKSTLANSAWLAAAQLVDPQYKLKSDEKDISQPAILNDHGSVRPTKKRAIGHGQSPTSSVRTSYPHEQRKLRRNDLNIQEITVKDTPSEKSTNSLLEPYPTKAKLRSLDAPRVIRNIKLRHNVDFDPDLNFRPDLNGKNKRPKTQKANMRPTTTGKRLFDPELDSPAVSQAKTNSSRSPSTIAFHRLNDPSTISENHGAAVVRQKPTCPNSLPTIVRQPETRPISQEQLVAEVKGIYAGLVMVEGKCIQVDAKQAALAREAPCGTQPKLNNEQWQALIALHRTLLHEHRDFFLASQHPSATPAVRKLAIKYAMPARLWRHGIHSFLELLGNRLPDSLDHMLAFIYLAYSMMTLLYETVPAFEDTWIECLGDLGRYRIAIEDDDIKDREVWTQVARQWYLKATDRSPETGRLYHHLAILAGPNALQQLFFYYKALSVPQSFPAARKSVLTLFNPILKEELPRRFPAVITACVKAHARVFARTYTNSRKYISDFLRSLDEHVRNINRKYLEQLYYISLISPSGLLSSNFKSTANYIPFPKRLLSGIRPSSSLPIYILLMKATVALPTGPPSETNEDRNSVGFTNFWKDTTRQFTDDMAGPLLFNLCMAGVVTAAHIGVVKLHRGLCKDWDLLLTMVVGTSLGFFFIAMDERLSAWQVAILWTLPASFITSYLKEKLVDLNLSGISAFSIVASGIGGSALLANYTRFDGRFSDPWILACVAVLPFVAFFTCLWVAFLHQTKVIHGIENGKYVKPVLNVLEDVYNATKIWLGIPPPEGVPRNANAQKRERQRKYPNQHQRHRHDSRRQESGTPKEGRSENKKAS